MYGELERLAGAQLRREAPGHTLQPTALVNEAYLRLVGTAGGWGNRRRFFGTAARAYFAVAVIGARPGRSMISVRVGNAKLMPRFSKSSTSRRFTACWTSRYCR